MRPGEVTCSNPGDTGGASGARPRSLQVAGRWALVSTWVVGRGAEASDPARPCQSWEEGEGEERRESGSERGKGGGDSDGD